MTKIKIVRLLRTGSLDFMRAFLHEKKLKFKIGLALESLASGKQSQLDTENRIQRLALNYGLAMHKKGVILGKALGNEVGIRSVERLMATNHY